MMRENFDFVTMDTYDADMKALSNHAASLAHYQQQRIRELEAVIVSFADANGGTIRIPYTNLRSLRDRHVTVERDEFREEWKLTVAPPPHKESNGG